MKKIAYKWVPIVLAGLLWFGCAGTLTYEGWETIKNGDSPTRVEAVLGEPYHTTDMTWVYLDPDQEIIAHIYMKDGKVNGKTWKDPKRGMAGTAPMAEE